MKTIFLITFLSFHNDDFSKRDSSMSANIQKFKNMDNCLAIGRDLLKTYKKTLPPIHVSRDIYYDGTRYSLKCVAVEKGEITSEKVIEIGPDTPIKIL